MSPKDRQNVKVTFFVRFQNFANVDVFTCTTERCGTSFTLMTLKIARAISRAKRGQVQIGDEYLQLELLFSKSTHMQRTRTINVSDAHSPILSFVNIFGLDVVPIQIKSGKPRLDHKVGSGEI
jgi:hypothetical protein